MFVSLPVNGATGYFFTATSDNPDFVPDTNLTFTGSGGVRTLTIAPVTGLYDYAYITVSLTDGPVTFAERFKFSVGLFADCITEGSNRVIRFSAFSGRTYNIQRATSLMPPNWTTIGTGVQVRDGSYEFKDSSAPGALNYYRIQSP
jgi:hypothetical protein